MAGTIHQPWLMKSSEEEDWWHQRESTNFRRKTFRDPKGGSVSPDFKHKTPKKLLLYTTGDEELKRRGFAVAASTHAHNRNPCHKTEKVIHDSAVSTHAHDGKPYDRNVKVIHGSSPLRNNECTAFVALLRTCAKTKDLHTGTKVHDDILKRGLLNRCSDALVTMYARCGALVKAQELLDMHKSRNVFSWTALIAAYCRQGQGQDALKCFERMMHEGLSPDAVTLACILRACGSLKAADKGKQIHNEIDRQGLLGRNVMLGNALVDMYVKCGALAQAQRVLEELPCRDVVSWNTLISGYTQHGKGEHALECFEQMQYDGVSPDAVTFACILKACGSIKAVDKGEQIHDVIAKQGLLKNDIVLGNALVDMYAKCGALVKAQCVFEELPSRNVVSWSSLIAGYAQQGQGQQALDCFERMQWEGLSPNAMTFACILKACGNINGLDKGEQIHDEIARQGLLEKDVVLGNALVDMYAKCGALAKAQQVLNELPSRDVVSWNALITGYAQLGQGKQALMCFEQMQHEGLHPNAVTFTCILKACGSIGAADKGEQIHDEISKRGLLGNNLVLGNALVDMYVKCGALDTAARVLKELPSRYVASWNALIAGYVKQGQGEQALNCFEEMQSEGLSPDVVTFTCILKACGTIGAVDQGENIHDEIARQGLLEDNVALGNALVDMYARCGALEKAQQVLQDLPSSDVVTWSALIEGYVQQGQGQQALNCFEQMQREGLCPDEVTFACVLKACRCVGAADKGQKIHDEIAKQGLLENDIVLGNALIDMYAKCGALAKAQRVLEELPSRDVVSWNTLITGYVQQCQGEQALKCFEQMQHEDVAPNAVTFSCVLNACSHLGLVEDGHIYFVNMRTKYGIKPELEHYTCMVDLYGRAGHLDKAVRMIQEVPSHDNSAIWSALLSACQKWGDVTVGRWAFEEAVRVDKSDAAAYVLMGNIYAVAGMQEDAKNIETMRRVNEAWSCIGVCSLVREQSTHKVNQSYEVQYITFNTSIIQAAEGRAISGTI